MEKLITGYLGLLALAAFALPAGASAANTPLLTHPTGTKLATGTKITATNIGNIVLKNDAGTVTLTECTTASMTGELLTNNGTEVEANIEATSFSGTGGVLGGVNECTGTFGNFRVTTNGITNGTPWCVHSDWTMAADEFQVRGGKCTELPAKKITFIFDTTITPGGSTTECKYERAATEPIKGIYTTDTSPELSDAVLHLTAGANTTFKGETGNNVLCPTQVTLQMSFTLETDTTPASDPLYFS